MLSAGRRSRLRERLLLGLGAVVVVVVLCSAAARVHRDVVRSRAQDAEILFGLSVFGEAEDKYHAEHETYGEQTDLEKAGLISETNFEHRKYVRYSDFSISLFGDDNYFIEWRRPSPASGRAITDHRYVIVLMTSEGVVGGVGDN